ncbi:MAG: DUF6063 family protein [Eubacterium sp.]|nr:DUF6063 family protein [Eubacterium sp.]
MEEKTLSKAMDIFSMLMSGEEIAKNRPGTSELYQIYYANAEVYELVTKLLARLNISVYEYNETLFVTAGEGNKVFGYTNDDLKRILGLRRNRELYLVYFIIYQALLFFYTDSAAYQVKEYVRMEELLEVISRAAEQIVAEKDTFNHTAEEQEGFRSVALLWHELPLMVNEDKDRNKASRGSRYGYVKLTMNFLQGEKLFLSVDDRFYPTDRFRAIVEGYFEDGKGRIYRLLGGTDDAQYQSDSGE